MGTWVWKGTGIMEKKVDAFRNSWMSLFRAEGDLPSSIVYFLSFLFRAKRSSVVHLSFPPSSLVSSS
jgi:hypothetical protein